MFQIHSTHSGPLFYIVVGVVAGLAVGTSTGSHSKHVFELDIVVRSGNEGRKKVALCDV